MPFPKRVLYYSLLAALTLLAFEGMARAAYWLAFQEGYGGGGPARSPAAAESATSGWPNIRHPFYGFAARSAYDLHFQPPPQKRDDEVVIAVLGGSVAEDVLPSLRRALYAHFDATGRPGRPVILVMSRGGLKQPQQATVIANTLALGGRFDLIVNLDGYNEVYIAPEDFHQGAFPFFPLFWDKMPGLTAAETLLAGRIGVLRAEQERRRRSAATHPLRYTAAWGLLHRYRQERTERRIIQLNHDLAAAQAAYSLEKHGPQPALPEAADGNPAAARAWYRGSRLLAELAAVAGAEYYHFLQPSQYIPDAKPLTDQERRRFYQPEPWGENYRRVYPRLAQLGQELARQGVNYFDLSYIFRNNAETLYRDVCCHLNERGNELLAAAMVARMAPALNAAAGSEPPHSGLAAAAATAPQPPEELLIDAAFQVYRRDGNRLVYVKDDCAPPELRHTFFLHIVPVDLDNLEAARRAYGFDNLDFSFGAAGGILGDQCIAERRMPGYAIAAIRTGQHTGAGSKIWEAEYRFERNGR